MLDAPTKEALFVLGVMTLAAAGAIIGITLWLTNGSSSGGAEAAPPPPPPAASSTPATTAAATSEAATTEAATTAAETSGGGSAQGDPAAGKKVFTSAGCTSCHTLADAGATGTVGPNLDEKKPPYDLVVERVTNGKSPMPPFKDSLSAQQIQDVAAYVVQATSG
jgi:mono/diheme cytochrome c family protein